MDQLREDAVNKYGITNAGDMSDAQLKAEIKAIDDQAKSAEKEEPKQGPKQSVRAKSAANDPDSKAANSASETHRRGILRRSDKTDK